MNNYNRRDDTVLWYFTLLYAGLEYLAHPAGDDALLRVGDDMMNTNRTGMLVFAQPFQLPAYIFLLLQSPYIEMFSGI